MCVVAFSLDDNLTILIEECEKLLKYEGSVNQQQNKYNWNKRMTNLNANGSFHKTSIPPPRRK
jgi:hypothetical protein